MLWDDYGKKGGKKVFKIMNNPSELASQNSKEKNICNKGRRTHFALNGGQFEHLSGTTLAWVPWIPGNPRIFQ